MVLKEWGATAPGEAGLQSKEPDPQRLYELIIIGGGPAGMTAGLYAARKRMETLLLSQDFGGQVLLTKDVENYMGYYYITGMELIEKFEKQVEQFPIAVGLGEDVVSIAAAPGKNTVTTGSGKTFQGKTLIVASGKRSRPLGVPGEKELVGRGVSYCTTCDAPLFGGRKVAVIGGGNSALTGVADLLKIAASITIVNILDSWQADAVLVEKAEQADNVEVLLGHEAVEIKGDGSVSSIVVREKAGGAARELAVEGVFIEIGLLPNSELAKGVLELNQWGEIVVDCGARTSVPGIFAAGDVTTVPEKQIIVAAGEGCKAALAAHEFLLRGK